jgi:hypothetical protein
MSQTAPPTAASPPNFAATHFAALGPMTRVIAPQTQVLPSRMWRIPENPGMPPPRVCNIHGTRVCRNLCKPILRARATTSS